MQAVAGDPAVAAAAVVVVVVVVVVVAAAAAAAAAPPQHNTTRPPIYAKSSKRLFILRPSGHQELKTKTVCLDSGLGCVFSYGSGAAGPENP